MGKDGIVPILDRALFPERDTISPLLQCTDLGMPPEHILKHPDRVTQTLCVPVVDSVLEAQQAPKRRGRPPKAVEKEDEIIYGQA